VWLPNGARFLAAHLGATAAGVLSVPLKADSGPVEVLAALADAWPDLVIAERELVARLPDGLPAEVPWWPAEEIALAGAACDVAPLDVAPDHPASALYSYFFGEGRPYAAVLTHGNHLFAAGHCADFHDVQRGDRLLVVLPMLHVFAMGMAILTSLYRGATVYVGRSIKPRSLLDTLTRERITHLPAVPQLHQQLARFFDPGRHRLDAVKHFVSGAEYLPAEVHHRIAHTLGVRLIQGYGLTECFPTVCNPPNGDNRPGTLGIGGNPRIHFRTVSPDGRPLGPGEEGEVVIRSPGVMSGYLDAPAATARVLRDGWLHSGDVGYVDGDGYLHFVGLIKPILNLAGNKVDPVEVAEVISRLPGVAAARIDPLVEEDEGLTTVSLRATVEPVPGAQVEARDVRAHCRRWLSSYKVPREVVFGRVATG
jgi:acyl-CoA synthetase (AMP-forming)/AMP-acid ligase II